MLPEFHDVARIPEHQCIVVLDRRGIVDKQTDHLRPERQRQHGGNVLLAGNRLAEIPDYRMVTSGNCQNAISKRNRCDAGRRPGQNLGVGDIPETRQQYVAQVGVSAHPHRPRRDGEDQVIRHQVAHPQHGRRGRFFDRRQGHPDIRGVRVGVRTDAGNGVGQRVVEKIDDVGQREAGDGWRESAEIHVEARRVAQHQHVVGRLVAQRSHRPRQHVGAGDRRTVRVAAVERGHADALGQRIGDVERVRRAVTGVLQAQRVRQERRTVQAGQSAGRGFHGFDDRHARLAHRRAHLVARRYRRGGVAHLRSVGDHVSRVGVACRRGPLVRNARRHGNVDLCIVRDAGECARHQSSGPGCRAARSAAKSDVFDEEAAIEGVRHHHIVQRRADGRCRDDERVRHQRPQRCRGRRSKLHGFGNAAVHGADRRGMAAAAVVAFDPYRAVAFLSVVTQERLIGKGDVGRDAVVHAQHHGQRYARVVEGGEGHGGIEVIHAPGEHAGRADGRGIDDVGRRIAAGESGRDEAHPGGDHVGDDQVVAGELRLIGDRERIRHQVVCADVAGHIVHTGDEHVVEIDGVLIVRIQADPPGGELAVGAVENQRAVDIDPETVAGSLNFDVIPAIGLIAGIHGCAQ